MFCILEGPLHVFKYVNEAHIRVLGFDATGMAVREAQPESVEVHGILDDVYRTGVTAHLNEIPVTVGTKLRHFNLTYAAKRDKTGNINGILILGIEVTDQVLTRENLKRANQEAHESLKTLDAVVYNLSEGMIFLDTKGTILLMNPVALEIHGFDSVEDMKTKLDEYTGLFEIKQTSGDPLPFEEWPVNKVLQGKKFFDYEVELLRKDHPKSLSVSYSGTPVLDESGKVILAVMMVRDITRRKQTEKALKEAVEARDEFLSIASHELKTPLTSLSLQFQLEKRLLKKNPSDVVSMEKVSSLIDQAERFTKRITRLVDDMLDISRIKSGKLAIKKETVHLGELVTDVIKRLDHQFKASGVSPTVNTTDVTLECDSVRIEQVLTNLIINAIRYGQNRPIDINLYTENDFAVFKVKDQGIGISPEDQKKIFDRFERAVNANDISGLGLGLYISQHIIKAHDGELIVESEKDNGATFIVRLPLK
jgi:signal transduction histidine kinase